jgi:endonuclease/exonuclease/phosphatase family metal-dependent hydrolase
MISLLTINTWKNDGDYLKRLEVLLRNIQKADPQLILLQEAFQSVDNVYDTTKFLTGRLNYHYTSSLSRLKKRKLMDKLLDSYSNVSVISEFPIVKSYIVPMPSSEADGGRDAIAAEIVINNKRILVISIHLSHLRNEELRKQQLSDLLSQTFLKAEYDGIFVGGDFNTSISKEYLDLFQNDIYCIEDTHKYKTGRDEPDYTLSVGNFSVKIDHILQINRKGKKMLEVSDSQIVFHEPDPISGIKASDHNGVMIQINI